MFLLVAWVRLAAGEAAYAQGDPEPGELKVLTRPGEYATKVGDGLLFSTESNPSLGPANPASTLRIEVNGEGVSKKVGVCFRSADEATPRAAGEVRVYLLAEIAGEATILMRLVDGTGGASRVHEYEVKLSTK